MGNVASALVARGFIPAGLSSSPKQGTEWARKIEFTALGLLRSPTGINPLATKSSTEPGLISTAQARGAYANTSARI